MANFSFSVLNAFALEPYGGNPAAVLLDAHLIPEKDLQKIARQLNLVETVFVYPSTKKDIDYHLRYFTPLKELPVAGHPTIAAWVELGRVRKLDPQRSEYVQETAHGTQRVSVVGSGVGCTVSMSQPSAKYTGPLRDIAQIAESIGLDISDIDSSLPTQGVDAGLGHIIVPIKSLEALMRAKMDIDKVRTLCNSVGMREMQLFTMHAQSSDHDLHTRNFTPRIGMEDPACGNGNGALGAYIAQTLFSGRESFCLRAEQGHACSMPSLIEIHMQRNRAGAVEISIAGSAIHMISGHISTETKYEN